MSVWDFGLLLGTWNCGFWLCSEWIDSFWNVHISLISTLEGQSGLRSMWLGIGLCLRSAIGWFFGDWVLVCHCILCLVDFLVIWKWSPVCHWDDLLDFAIWVVRMKPYCFLKKRWKCEPFHLDGSGPNIDFTSKLENSHQLLDPHSFQIL